MTNSSVIGLNTDTYLLPMLFDWKLRVLKWSLLSIQSPQLQLSLTSDTFLIIGCVIARPVLSILKGRKDYTPN